jgi:hypothetical protein
MAESKSRLTEVLRMSNANDFWVSLAKLEEAYREGGSTPSERAAAALRQFEGMSPVARGEMLAALRTVSYQMFHLYSIAGARANSLGPPRAATNQKEDPTPELIR